MSAAATTPVVTAPRYFDVRGREWTLVSETRAGKYGWFRAVGCTDPEQDQHFRMDDMRDAEWVARHNAARAAHIEQMRARDPLYVVLIDIARAGAGGGL